MKKQYFLVTKHISNSYTIMYDIDLYMIIYYVLWKNDTGKEQCNITNGNQVLSQKEQTL